MVKDLVILASGGLAQECAWLVEEINDDKRSFNLLGFLDDDMERVGREYIGYPVLGNLDAVARYPLAHFISGVGDPRVRKLTVEKVEQCHPMWTNLVSPTVRLHKSNKVGSGVMIGRHTDLTVGNEIGNHVMLNIHVVIGHAVRIGDYSVVSPNACVNGEATIGRLCYIGANAFVRNVVVHDGATIGAGSVVTKDVAENTVVVGAPARLLHEGKPSHVLTRIPDEKP